MNVEDRETDRRARDVTGLTLGRIGNTNVAMARSTGQSDAWEGMWKERHRSSSSSNQVGKRTHKSSHSSNHRETADRRERASGQMGGQEAGWAWAAPGVRIRWHLAYSEGQPVLLQANGEE